MATSIDSQLKALKLFAIEEPQKRPHIEPSVIFDAKEAADIDRKSILLIAISGLDALANVESRFGIYRSTLFRQGSLNEDRSYLREEENRKLDGLIASYLRLLSGYLQLPAALKTLEYLIRQYKVHLHPTNVDELVLCALPYHDTQVFVRIVQLIDFGRNKKWGFLEGVKTSGAPCPRKVIVQQCIRDKGVLNAICNYASRSKDFQEPKPVVCFCTAVVVEALGSVPALDSDTVLSIRPFVSRWLNLKSSTDHKAGALMIVGLMASKATLAPKHIEKLIHSISENMQPDLIDSADLPWLRLTMMAIIGLVQSQSIESFPIKSLNILKNIRDLAGVLDGLSREFNIEKFLSLYIGALINYSPSDDSSFLALIKIIEKVCIKAFVDKIVSKVLGRIVSKLRRRESSELNVRGTLSEDWAKPVLVAIDKNYPSELRVAVRNFLKKNFLKNSKPFSEEEDFILDRLCVVLDGSLDTAIEISDPKVWLSMQHPKAEVRRAALAGLATHGVLNSVAISSLKNTNFQEAILLRGLNDEDLSVIHDVLSLKSLCETVNPSCLLQAFRNILNRCTDILMKSNSCIKSPACNVALSCLQHMVKISQGNVPDHGNEVATLIFPLLLLLPKSLKVNVSALELLKDIEWPVYLGVSHSHDLSSILETKSVEPTVLASINLKTIEALSEGVKSNPVKHMEWLAECCRDSLQSKTLFFLMIMQAFSRQNQEDNSLLLLFEAFFPFLKHEWIEVESLENAVLAEEFTTEKLDKLCNGVVEQLYLCNFESLNTNILICIFWTLLRSFSRNTPRHVEESVNKKMFVLEELFVFFSTTLSKGVFREHLRFLVTKCTTFSIKFLSKFFTEEGFPIAVQLESLHSFVDICYSIASTERRIIISNNILELYSGFPSLLVPLSSSDKDLRVAAVKCIEGLYKLWQCVDSPSVKNGNDTSLARCMLTQEFGEFLRLIVHQKELISSDPNVLPSLLTSLLGQPGDGLLVPHMDKRFGQDTKDIILIFILNAALKFSSYAKMMILSLLKGLGEVLIRIDVHIENGIKSLLSELIERRAQCFGLGNSVKRMSQTETDTLCLLLEICSSALTSSLSEAELVNHFFEALEVGDLSSEEPSIIQPCLTVLYHVPCAMYGSLTSEKQDKLFVNIVKLYRSGISDIQKAAKDALLKIKINCSMIARLLERMLCKDDWKLSSKNSLKRKKTAKDNCYGLDGETILPFISSLLDVMLLKGEMEKRDHLIKPLFQLLRKLFTTGWPFGLVGQDKREIEASSEISQSAISSKFYTQRMTLLILENITSLSLNPLLQDGMSKEIDIALLVEYARMTSDVPTLNHIFSLLSSISKVTPGLVSKHIVDIFMVIGEAATKQIDTHSQHVLEELISTLVPCWLSNTESVEKLLEIFINVLPDITEHRRLTLMVYLLRTLGEQGSLGFVLVLLFRSSVLRMISQDSQPEYVEPVNKFTVKEWEHSFALELCSQYSCSIWLPCLVNLLGEIGFDAQRTENIRREHIMELIVALQFILLKLQDTELLFSLESGQDSEKLQAMLGELMEKVVLHLGQFSIRREQLIIGTDVRNGLKECMHNVLNFITKSMIPSAFFKSITHLLAYTDETVKRKALGLLSEAAKDHEVKGKLKEKKKSVRKLSNMICMDERATESFNGMVMEILHVIDDSSDTVKVAALSALETLAKIFLNYNFVFTACLVHVVKPISPSRLAVSSSCLRTTGALINVLGSKALSELPEIMKIAIETVHHVSTCSSEKFKNRQYEKPTEFSSSKEAFLSSVLIFLEAIVDKLGCFLNPYLEDIIHLMVVHSEYASETDLKIKSKAVVIRKLVAEKIPVRLILPPLMKIYHEAVACGESSIALVFEIFATMINAMDRSSVVSYHEKIHQQCLLALDLRRQLPPSVKTIDRAEERIIDTVVLLTMKLTETMFRPLFIRSLEWAECELGESETIRKRSIDRTISFYKLVNKLAEQHRSVFVPYFKYLIDGFTRYLTEDQDTDPVDTTQKRKKAKLNAKSTREISTKHWHLRSLILSSLYMCFLNDTGSLKFLDSSNFQVLLKPVVSQLVVDPPATLELIPGVPKLEEVNEILVCCLGQMAVASGSDLLWKSLNHEVLMQTRSEKVRARILGLRTIKYLLDHLKEEYLVFLAETIPFLGELLEDVEPAVKSLAQSILIDMEALSGESLRQYL
ncbi:hypothetical protein QJS04_geneDACA018413 [Acorus gramineus]|uniref:BP28 C-terminal domain-containing protein n=1 Tax=Acorus gramineus TaxID=55184 RepID=A0AAV9AEX8_ACOGR|nr:hypothetical protein QJS04_geneDACA018413 [Acorus gramineus]